ncbi:MAG TPA: hypothetical protein VF783_13115 [Terriglobales bacterium]
MKELIEKLIAAIPAYVRQMIELLRNPREFIEKIDLDSDDALKEALMFLAISFALVFIAEIQLLPQKQNKEILFGVSAVLAAVSFTASVLLLLVSWKIVGGKAYLQKVHHRFLLLHGCLEPDAPDLYPARIWDFQWPRPGKHPSVTQ